MTLKLRDYQEHCISEVRQAFGKHKRVLLVSPTGSGKTNMFSYVARGAFDKGKRILILAHRDELLRQIGGALKAWGVPHAVLRGGMKFTPKYKVIVGSVQTVVKRMHKMEVPDIIVTDECFVAGTIVSGKNIEDIKIGDEIECFDEIGNVQLSTAISIIKREAPEILYKIEFNDGSHVVCTGNHPFYTQLGWILASELKCGSMVHCITLGDNYDCIEMQDLPTGIQPNEESNIEQQSWQGCHMQCYLQKQIKLNDSSENKQTICFGQNEEEEPNEERNNKRKNEDHSKVNRTHAKSSPWQRAWANTARAITVCGTWLADKCGGKSWHGEIQRIPYVLQARHREREIKDRYRSGRGESLQHRAQASGREKNKTLGVVRVEDIKIYQRSSRERFAEVCPDGFVYNVGVNTYHTYFANNIAVHNCHHARPDNTYGKIYSHFPNALLMHVTATPERLDGRGLDGVADEIIIGPDTAYLTDNGWLSRARVFAPKVLPDLSKVKKRAGDYAIDELELEMNKRVITGDAIEHWRKHADGKATVCFCVSVKHAEDVAAQFVENGIPAKSIDGKMSLEQRQEIMEELRSGKILVLTSCDLISEGVDVPKLEAAILLRPTESMAVYLQQVGRCLRPMYAEGYDLNVKEQRLASIAAGPKPFAIILDHAGNCIKHDLPTATREWSLKGKDKKQRKGEKTKTKLRTCPECFAIHEPAPICPVCETPYEVKAREIEQESGDLEEIKARSINEWKINRLREMSKCKTLEDLVELGVRKGYKNPRGWAWNVWKARERKRNAANRTPA